MTDLVEFLRARLDEDEQAAQRANAMADHAWASSSDEVIRTARGELGSFYDPARVLREVEVKREIVKLHGIVHTLRLLAMPYADHPDYQQEWEPEIS